jgi:signal transduction histidine kinase
MRPGVLSSSIALIVGTVSVVGFAFAEHSTNQQEHDLLQGSTNEAAALASQYFSALDNSIVSAAAVVKSTGGDPASFQRAEAPLSKFIPMVLAKKVGSTYTVTATSGNAFTIGQHVTGAALSTISGATRGFTIGPVTYNGKTSTARFALGVTSNTTDFVVFEQFSLDPFKATPATTGKPFEQLKATLYGPGPVTAHNLLISTSTSLPLNGPLARASVGVGTSATSSHFTLVASARHPFIGGFARLAPYLLLLLGLLLAGILGITIESLHRRQRYARELVKERTAELERSLRNLEEAQDALVRGERLTAVGEMAMVVGHELRNPLAAVINALYLIRAEVKEPMSEMLSRNLSMAERETGKAATLADDLTAFVRPREMDRVPIAVEGLVEEVLSVTPLPDGIALMTDVEPFTLVADRGQMAEILTNLVTNAYQAMPDGGTLGIRATHEADGAHLTIEDSGSGIDEAVADRVFEPFFTTKYNGTGLGLAIVQRLVIAHGGHIDFENVPTGGARVTLSLPDLLELVTR